MTPITLIRPVDRRYLSRAAIAGAAIGVAAWSLALALMWGTLVVVIGLVFAVLGALLLKRVAREHLDPTGADRASMAVLLIPVGLVLSAPANPGPFAVVITAAVGAAVAILGALFGYVRLPWIDRSREVRRR